MVTAGRPYYGRLADMDFAKIRDLIGKHLLLALYVARNAANKVRPGGTRGRTGGRGRARRTHHENISPADRGRSATAGSLQSCIALSSSSSVRPVEGRGVWIV